MSCEGWGEEREEGRSEQGEEGVVVFYSRMKGEKRASNGPTAEQGGG